MLPVEEMVTPFNRELYRRIVERSRQGLLVELAFLAADYDEQGMAYISRMVGQAREKTVTPEEVDSFAAVIREEHALRGMRTRPGCRTSPLWI